MILQCNCQHAEQDKLYGKGNRVHNPALPAKLKQGEHWYRCTVCKKEKLA
mgnify:CR=1 FL=1